MYPTVASLIERWPAPSTANFGRDLGISVEHASTIKRRNSIPVKFWERVVTCAADRGIPGIDYDTLVAMRARRAA